MPCGPPVNNIRQGTKFSLSHSARHARRHAPTMRPPKIANLKSTRQHLVPNQNSMQPTLFFGERLVENVNSGATVISSRGPPCGCRVLDLALGRVVHPSADAATPRAISLSRRLSCANPGLRFTQSNSWVSRLNFFKLDNQVLGMLLNK